MQPVAPRLGREEDGIVVGFFGYWYRGKGIEVLASALAEARANGLRIRARLWGDVSPSSGRREGERYRQAVLSVLRRPEVGPVEILGYLDDAEVRPSLRACDAVVLP